MAALAPLIDGSASKEQLRGTWHGYAVEARPGAEREWTFALRGVAGHQPWSVACDKLDGRRSAGPQPMFVAGIPSGWKLAQMEKATSGFDSDLDPEVEERLRAGGLIEQIVRLPPGAAIADPTSRQRIPFPFDFNTKDLGIGAGLAVAVAIMLIAGAGDSGDGGGGPGGSPSSGPSTLPPRVTFVPSTAPAVETMLSRLPAFAGLTPDAEQRLEANGRLTCQVVVPEKRDLPTPEEFLEWLGVAERIAEINAQANPSPEPKHLAVAPALDRPDARSLEQALVGSWSNEMLTIVFRPDGTLTAARGRKHKEGAWSIESDGRLRVTGVSDEPREAWLAGDELTVVFGGREVQGVGLKFRRA